MSAVQMEILDKISSMTVLELSELIKAMEEKFGVSAAAAQRTGGSGHKPPGFTRTGRPLACTRRPLREVATAK